MGKINEIQQYYQSLKLKDSQHQQYFLDILATNDGAQNIIQLVDKSSGKKATGAEMFLSMVNHARENGYDILTIREYKGCTDEFEPVATVNFRLCKKKKKQNNNNKMPRPYTQPQQQQTQFSGFGSLDEINQGLGSLGVRGGLSGLIEESAKRIADSDKIARYEEELRSLKAKNASLENKLERQKDELETAKDNYKDLQRTVRDMEHDHKWEMENTNKNNSMLSLGMNALMGIVMEKSGLGNQLSGILGNNSESVQEVNQNTENVSLAPINPEKQKYIDAITNYINDLELPELEKVAAIAQYISMGVDNLDRVVSYCKNQVSE